MLLVNLSILPWNDYQLKRNRAVFINLLRGSLFEGGAFINPPIISRQRWGKYASAPRLVSVQHQSDPDLAIEVVQPIYSLPYWYLSHLRTVWARQIQQNLADTVIRGRPYCLWLNCPGFLSNALARALAPSATFCVFDSSDDFKARPDPTLAPNVDEMASLADLVICVNEATAARIDHPRKRVFSNCTSWTALQQRKAGFHHPPVFPKPPGDVYIGFIGSIHETRADEPLLYRLFKEFPHYRFVFVGSTDRPEFLERLTAFQNVAFLPDLPYEDLPEVIRSFDVAIVPHLDNPCTRGNDLLKVLDYLACGVPVVTTRCSNVERYGSALYIAGSHDEFISHVSLLASRQLSHDPGPGEAIVQERTWERNVPILAKEIQQWLLPHVLPARTVILKENSGTRG